MIHVAHVWVVTEDYDSPYVEDREAEIIGVFWKKGASTLCVKGAQEGKVRIAQRFKIYNSIRKWEDEVV